MNELSTQRVQLPDTLDDLSKFVLVGREKLNAVRAEIRAIDKVGLAKEVHEQKLAEAQDIAEAVLDAEVQIGKLTSRMETSQGKRSDIEHGNTAVTKSEQLSEIGLSKMQASRYESLASHPEYVEQAKAEARELGNIVTRQNVINKIAGEHETKQKQAARELREAKKRVEEFAEQKSDGIVSFDDARQNKEDQELVSESFINEFDKLLQHVRHFRYMGDDGRFAQGFAGLDKFEQRAIVTHLSEMIRAIIKLQRVTEEIIANEK